MREANAIKRGEPPHFGHSMFMILSWSLRLLEHAGCLASLQHCLVHRVSSFRDLTLGPGGLRVLAREMFVFQYFLSRFIAWVCCRANAYKDCAVTGREDAVSFGGALDWGFCRRFSRYFEQRVSLFPQEDFSRV